MKKLKVLVGCEFSQIVTKAFRERGHGAFSCDLIDCEINKKWHIKGDVLQVLDYGWDLAIFHPPCTYLTNAGVRHLYDHVKSKNGKVATVSAIKRWLAMQDASQFFLALTNAPIPKICIENPIPHKHAKALIGEYTQLIQPWQFGEKQCKAICLWLKGLPKLVPTNPGTPEEISPEWLTAVLRSAGVTRGAEVAAVETTEIGLRRGYVCRNIRLVPAYDSLEPGVPASFVLKMPGFIVYPEEETMRIGMELALGSGGLEPAAIGYVNGHGTATEHGDIAETRATSALFGPRMPIRPSDGTPARC